VLPQLRELEHRFPRELAIVGVHSGKYIAERETARILEATKRLGVVHPVVNDRQYRIWRSFAVRAWPTIVVIDPTGAVLGSHAGEITADMIAPLIERLIRSNDETGILDRRPLEFPTSPSAIVPGALRYPEKVAVMRDWMAIADTGHHRILVGRLEKESRGRRLTISLTLGDGVPGLVDGAQPRFNAPHGVAFANDTLFVADTENHAVRAVDLRSGIVRTVAGTGRQMRTMREGLEGALSSPWDLAVVDGMVFIAMAGTHQIWALKGESARAGAESVAGTGAEDIGDGPLGDARLAQPMGMAGGGDGTGVLFFADAESSAVRFLEEDRPRVAKPMGEVRTIVGTGLFDFGDKDGTGDGVRLQHPQGIAWHPSGRLLVADSYNDAVKWIDPATRAAETWVRGFHEPGGLAYDAERALVYVADTNAHRIAIINERTGEVSELDILRNQLLSHR
jgi:sugar lactone lactonase YvrE